MKPIFITILLLLTSGSLHAMNQAEQKGEKAAQKELSQQELALFASLPNVLITLTDSYINAYIDVKNRYIQALSKLSTQKIAMTTQGCYLSDGTLVTVEKDSFTVHADKKIFYKYAVRPNISAIIALDDNQFAVAIDSMIQVFYLDNNRTLKAFGMLTLEEPITHLIPVDKDSFIACMGENFWATIKFDYENYTWNADKPIQWAMWPKSTSSLWIFNDITVAQEHDELVCFKGENFSKPSFSLPIMGDHVLHVSLISPQLIACTLHNKTMKVHFIQIFNIKTRSCVCTFLCTGKPSAVIALPDDYGTTCRAITFGCNDTLFKYEWDDEALAACKDLSPAQHQLLEEITTTLQETLDDKEYKILLQKIAQLPESMQKNLHEHIKRLQDLPKKPSRCVVQ